MSTATLEKTADYLEAIEHLPPGALLRLARISWGEYDDLLNQLSDHPGFRVNYNEGSLEIMSPLPDHEKYKSIIQSMALIISLELGSKLEMFGSTTFRQKRNRQGVEPDESFYVQNADAVLGKSRIDLSVDPPPDVVVEIDITNESESKFPIYAAFGVAEIWRYDGRRAWMYQLVDNRYVKIDRSLAFPMLTPPVIAKCIERSKSRGQLAALAAFRQWVRERKPA